MTLLAHISDLHLDGSARAAGRVRLVMDHLRALSAAPDALLVTGGIADRRSRSAAAGRFWARVSGAVLIGLGARSAVA